MKKEDLKTSPAPFDYRAFEEEAIQGIKDGKSLEGKGGVLAPLIKRLVEAGLEGELDVHLQDSKGINRRNGKLSKKVKTGFGPININTPRDRNSSFEPQTLPKRVTTLGDAIDHKVISMYSKGVSYNDICTHLEDLYGLTVSPGTLSAITNRVLDDIKLWQSRPLETVYPFLWLDAIHYKVREDHAIKTKAVYCVLGLTREGIKDLLGLYISENEGARFWLSVLSDLQSRGIKDILIACIDNLKGFAQAIESIFPQTEVQLCVVHQLRNSLRYVPWKEKASVMQSLKSIYQAPNKEIAERALNELDLLWGEKYPSMVKSWLNNWDRLSNYFKYPSEIRRVIYTTNIIESFHSQLRKITKSKRVFTSDMSLIKLLYMAYTNLKRGWSGGIGGWKLAMSQLMIIFEERMNAP